MSTLTVPRMYHAALDDVIVALKEIHERGDAVQSLFDHEVLARLREFHRRYGAVFTLYLFYEMPGFNLTQVSDRFRDEWIANSDWLRLSFHSRTRIPEKVDYYLYTQRDYDTARRDFEDIKREILRFAGPQVWDNFPRTHFWSGNRETLRAWRDCGVSGMFFSYPGYAAFDFDQALLEKLWERDYADEPDVPMLLITTNVKLPCLTVAEVQDRLAELKARGARILEIFADDYNLIDLSEHMETALAFAHREGYVGMFYDEAFAEAGAAR